MEDFSDKAVAFLQKAWIPLLAVVVVAIGASMFYSYSKHESLKKLEASQNELFVIKKEIQAVTDTINPPEPEPEFDKDGKPLPPKAKKPAPTMSDAEKQKAYAPGLEKLNAYIKANQGGQGAVEGALLAAEISTDYKKYDDGINALKTALNGFDKKNFLFGIAQTEMGNLLAKTDQCAEAAQAWEQVIAQKEHDYLANDLRLKAGICYEKTNQYDRAEGLYQAVVEKAPESSAARTAKKFLLHIKYVKTKGPGAEAAPEKKG